jgi:hypothetical protein
MRKTDAAASAWEPEHEAARGGAFELVAATMLEAPRRVELGRPL